jgi:lysophospholipase L1-like esterase
MLNHKSFIQILEQKLCINLNGQKKLYYDRIELFKQDTLKFNQIVFLGNSITEGGKDWNEKFGVVGISNRGISGDSTDGVIARLNEIIHFSPRAIFLLIGINDIYNDLIPSTDYVANNILKIIKLINHKIPETKIFLQTILPVEKKIYKEKIIEVNGKIKTFVSQSKFEIIDLYSVFVNKEGIMKKELSYDGVHLNDKGYSVWVDHIKPTVLSLANHK